MKWYRIFIDLDGTIAGDSEWKSFWWNTYSLFRNELWRPPVNISWSILTGRPRIDYLIIKLFCCVKNLSPDRIITTPSWTYKNLSPKEVAQWKFSILERQLRDPFTQDVIYVDSDPEILNNIPPLSRLHLCATDSYTQMMRDIEKRGRNG